MSNTVVRTNVMSLNSHRNLGMVANQQSRASARLSSGFRINSAADDAAGLGISEKMRSQIRGLDQASRNAADGISLIQTAEGALGTVNEILIRIRELVIQASNDTNVGGEGMQSDRLRIQDEIDQLMQEIDSISTRTEFNTRTLLDGSLSNAGIIRGGEWETVDQVRINAPAQIQTLDQFLRMTSNEMFTGSFAELLVTIGANLEGMSADSWIALHAGVNGSGLATALDIAMGVSTSAANIGTADLYVADSARWQELSKSAGLDFKNATELLNAFVQGLHNPNALRVTGSDVKPGDPQKKFESWSDFMSNANSSAISSGTFSRAVSNAGGETIADALKRACFGGLDSSSSFTDVRNIFNNMSLTAGGFKAGWAEPDNEMKTELLKALSTTAGNVPGWLQTRFGEFGNDNKLGLGNTAAAFNFLVGEYLTAKSETVERDVWVPNLAERETGKALWFQIGANSRQGINVEIGSMSTGTLFGREGANHSADRRIVNVLDVAGYNVQAGDDSNYGNTIGGNRVSTLIEAIDAALSTATRQRSELGAVQNRLEFTIENLDIASENLSAANSRIRDADMAKEMMRLTQANVLQQAAISMLAQANQAPQNVLQLLN